MVCSVETEHRAERISRRVIVQTAHILPVATVALGIASGAIDAQQCYGQSGPKMLQLLRGDLKGQDNRVQESIVTVVQFQAGQTAPWHTHPGAQEILYALDGEVTLMAEGQSARSIKAGEVALTPADVRHSVRNDKSLVAKVLVVHSRADKEEPLTVVAKD